MHVQYITFERILYERRGNGNDFGHCHKRLLLERINGSLLGHDLIGFDRYRQRHREILGGGKYGRGENRGLHGRRQDLFHHAERRLIIGQRVYSDDNQIRNRIGSGHNEPDGNGIRIGNPRDPDGNA